MVISGLQETESPSLDIKHTKEIVSSLDILGMMLFLLMPIDSESVLQMEIDRAY